MIPAAAGAVKTVEVVRTVRAFPWLRMIALLALAAFILWRYFIYPAIDRITPWEGIKPNPSMPNIPGTPWPLLPDPPWDGIIPGSCTAPPVPVEEPSGFPALWHDLGVGLRSLADGPPSAETMRGWFTDAGEATAEAVDLVGAGLRGQPIPLSSTPAVPTVPTVPMPVGGPAAPEDVAAAALLTAGASPQEAVVLTAIAGPESQWDPLADNPTSTATGLWQILDVHGLTVQQRQDPVTAARKALELARQPGGIERHWAQTAAASRAYEPRAAAAVTRVQTRAAAVCTAPAEPDVTWVNGQMPDGALTVMPGGQQLESSAAAAFYALSAAYQQTFGEPLVVGSGYRTYDEQAQLRRSKPNLAAAAGRSQHGLGLAADLSGPGARFGTGQYAWLLQNAPAFGWYHPEWALRGGSKPEPWHIEFQPRGLMRAG